MVALETMVNALLVDDHRLVVESIASRLSQFPGLRVLGTCSDCDNAATLARELRPDVIVLDLDLPGRGAFDLLADLRMRQPSLKCMFLTGFLSDVFIEQALRLDASYVLKLESPEFVHRAILDTAHGIPAFSQAVRERLKFDQSVGRFTLDTESNLSGLTGRQLEVLRHLARGSSVKEIAKLMHLSQKSVDSHKYRIMHKLGIHDRVELARYAIREGLSLP